MQPINKNLPIKADVHMHTKYSHGAAGTNEMFLSAYNQGLTVIGFSEHSARPEGYSYAVDYQEKLIANYANYILEVQEIKNKAFEKNITVLLGVEIDYISGHEDYAASLLDCYPYDYSIGGLHFQGTWGFDGPADEWTDFDQKRLFQIYKQYYLDMEKMCRTGLFNVVAHPDLIKIHTKEKFDEWLEFPESLEILYSALLSLKDAGMAMEISSAGLRKPCNEIYPGPKIMKMAKDIGVNISFGSDAHCSNTPAWGFGKLADYASSYGFRESAIFKENKPVFIPFMD